MLRKPALLILVAVLVMSSTVAICQTTAAQPAKTQSYKYQVVEVPGTMGSQPYTAAVRVNSGETEFAAYFAMMGRQTKVTGTIVNGVYKAGTGNFGNPMAMTQVDRIVKMLTKEWLPVTAEPGKTCKVTFTSNYEKQADTVLDVPSADIIVGPALKRYGYNFKGYYFDKIATKPLSQNAAASGDVTLYAGWEKWDAETLKYMQMYQDLMEKADYIMERAPAYEEKSFAKFYELAFASFLKVEAAGTLLNKDNSGMVTAALDALKEVKQVQDPEKVVWYIWGDKMAVEPGADKFEFFGNLDNEKWRPFLLPYMLKDQSKVKGNIIVVAGGGYFLRSNIEEAYSSAKVMNGLGYNCFVLQRRVTPYAMIDSSLDVQRAVRYLKFHAKEYGIAKIENLATSGFSGGGGTITNAAKTLYGKVSPSTVYASYVDDDIDKLDSDVKAMLVIYAGGDVKNSSNPNYPATFIAFGTLDFLAEGATEYFKDLKAKGIFAEIHAFAGAPHGFGAGTGIPDYTGMNPLGFFDRVNPTVAQEKPNKPYLLAYTGAQQWTKLADTFLDQVFKYKPVSY